MSEEINLWARLAYRDPEVTLRELRSLEVLTADWDVRDRVRRLRTGDLKNIREGRGAALFCHGLAAAMGKKIYFAELEASDYDFITCWFDGETRHFCPVQLKELPPIDLNSKLSLGELLSGLSKYQTTQTALAVLLSKPAQIEVSSLPEVARRFSQVWLFWQASADGSLWRIQGDVLRTFETYDFSYPVSDGAA